MDVLAFELGTHLYALNVADVREVLRAVAITSLPSAPAVVDGVVDVRGEIVPVLNLRRRFGLPVQPPGPDEHMVLARAGERAMLLRVDAVRDVVRLTEDAVRALDGVIGGTAYVSGVVSLPDGLVMIHDPATFLSGAERDELDAAIAEAGGADDAQDGAGLEAGTGQG